MSILEMALARQGLLLWGLLGMAIATLGFRMAMPAQRQSLRVTWVLLALSLAGWCVAAGVALHPVLTESAVASAVVLWGIAVLHLVTAVFFRGILPRFGLNMPRIAHDLTFTAMVLTWGLLWLRMTGVEPGQLFTTSALITAVLAFAMQDTLGNVLGGVTLQLDNSLNVGDWIRMDDVSGRVTDVYWRYTVIETRNREQVIVPNGWLMKNRFTVMRAGIDTPFAWRRAVNFNIEPDANPETVLRVLERSVLDAEVPHVLKTPPPSAILADIGAGYRRYTLRYWLGHPQFDDPSDSAVRIHALSALARAGICLGLPLEERLMVRESDSWRAAAGKREAAHRLQAIQRTALFAKLPLEEQEMLAAHLVHAPFAAGDVITRQGAVAHWLYLIVQGDAQVCVDTPEGRTPIATLQDGAFFGEMGMLTGEARSATVMALTGVECFRLDKEGFAQVLQARPEIAKEITAVVEARRAERGQLLAKAGQAVPNHDDILSKIMSFFSIKPD